MEIRYTKTAVKAIMDMDKSTRSRIKGEIEGIPQGDIMTLVGRNELRLRVGKYRVIFEYIYENGKKICVILDVGSRGDIYK